MKTTQLSLIVSVLLSIASNSSAQIIQQQIPNNAKREDPCTSFQAVIPQPQIEVDNSFDPNNSNQIRGYISGSCLKEAGLYEGGNKVQSISVTQSPEFKRSAFNVALKRGQSRELRVYNSQGGMASFQIADVDDSADPLGLGVRRLEEDEGLN